ncbi:MAG: hypothetical protein ACLTDR_02480 [Adlercreutzia equolifaciens]
MEQSARSGRDGGVQEHCSAIVATGSATVDGNSPTPGHRELRRGSGAASASISAKRVEPDDGYAFIVQASGAIVACCRP